MSAVRCYPWILNCTILHKGNKFQGSQQACFLSHLSPSEIKMPYNPCSTTSCCTMYDPTPTVCRATGPAWLSSVQFSSGPQLCLTLRNPMDCSTPGLPVHQQLPEFTQTHVHWVGAAIQPSHPLLSPSPPCSNLSQHQDLFKWVRSLHQEAKVLKFQLQPVLPVSIQDWFLLGWTGWISLQFKGLSSPSPQFKSINSLAFSLLYSPTLTSIHDYWKNHSFD